MKRIDASPGGITWVSWSPDSQWVAYVRGGGEVCIANAETGEIRVVGEGSSPGLTSDLSVVMERNDEIVFVTGRGEKTLVSRADLTKDTPKRAPLVSPDGERVLFVVHNVFDKTSQSKNAYPYRHFLAVSPIGGGRATLTDEQWYGGTCAWFPDGEQFAHYEFDSTGGARVHVVGADGEHRGTIFGHYPGISPDGQRIAVKPKGGGAVVVYTKREAWTKDGVDAAVLRIPESAGRIGGSAPMWLDNRFLMVEEGGRTWRLDSRRDKGEELKRMPSPADRGRRTVSLSPSRELVALEAQVEGGFELRLYPTVT